MTARLFRVGDRIRWTAPEHAHESLLVNGYPTSDETVVVPWPKAIDAVMDRVAVAAPQSPSHVALVPISWCSHLDDAPAAVPAKRKPDRACRYCHGTGAVLLVFSHAPCECVS